MNERNNQTALGALLIASAVLMILLLVGSGVAVWFMRSSAITQQAIAERSVVLARSDAEFAAMQLQQAEQDNQTRADEAQETARQLELLRQDNKALQARLREAQQIGDDRVDKLRQELDVLTKVNDQLRQQVEELNQEIGQLKSKSGLGDQ